jgi:hypothetical protein
MVFESMIQQLSTTAPPSKTSISKQEYEKFKKYFSFAALHGKGYGRAFCEHVGFTDWNLVLERDPAVADRYICNEYVMA